MLQNSVSVMGPSVKRFLEWEPGHTVWSPVFTITAVFVTEENTSSFFIELGAVLYDS